MTIENPHGSTIDLHQLPLPEPSCHHFPPALNFKTNAHFINIITNPSITFTKRRPQNLHPSTPTSQKPLDSTTASSSSKDKLHPICIFHLTEHSSPSLTHYRTIFRLHPQPRRPSLITTFSPEPRVLIPTLNPLNLHLATNQIVTFPASKIVKTPNQI
ncbi:hypothetical protein V6N11_057038 [Hibiscus sabdariffa]|uniref:Uncharacterized protein n=1 Tax=Hibiscus sabdariffa TaxID=183260 RepID=A0ABR1ZQM6_9ROSI